MNVTQHSIMNRWGIHVDELLADIAAQGLCLSVAAKVTGMSSSNISERARKAGIRFASPTMSRVAELTGKPFAEAVKDKADQGYTPRQAAELLGVDYMYFLQLAADVCAFESRGVARQHLIDTGKTVVEGARRAAAAGMHKEAAARHLGYKAYSGLKWALALRGVSIDFPPPRRKPKPYRDTPVGVYRNKNTNYSNHPWRKGFERV